MAGRAHHEQKNHRLGLRQEVLRLGRERILARGGEALALQQVLQGQRAKSVRGARQHIPARDGGPDVGRFSRILRGHKRTHFD